MPSKERIKGLFNNIAPDYDRLNHILSLNIDKGWRRKAVRIIADVKHPISVLDVACGTGDFTIAIAKKVVPGSTVKGIDISEGMIKIGMDKISAAQVNASMELGDCEALAHPDCSFDRISVGFGVRNFEHLELGLTEMHRVLKPDGKLVILELSIPSNRFVRWCYKLYFTKILPAIGGMVSGNRKAYDYLPASVIGFPPPAKFIGILQKSGFREVKHRSFTLGICSMYIAIK